MSAGAYRRALDLVTMDAARLIAALIRALYQPTVREESIRLLVPPLADVIRQQRARVYDETVRLIQDVAEARGTPDPYIPPQTGYSDESVRSALREGLRGSPDEAANRVSERLRQHVESAGRETVSRAVDDGREPADERETEDRSPVASDDSVPPERGRQPLSWARMLTGAEDCGFCVMLASRGPVYGSAEDAGRELASDKWPDARGYINSYHDNCDCITVPIYDFSDWEGRDQWKALEGFYKERIQDKQIRYGDGKAKNEVIAALDRELYRMKKEGESLPIPDLRST